MGILGYGVDLRCASDLREDMDFFTDPTDPIVIAEAIARRLDTPAGGLIDDPMYGFDVLGLLHVPMTDQELRTLGDRIRGEVLADDRVSSATVQLVPNGNPVQSIEITIRFVSVDPARGEFSAILEATDVGVLVREVLP